MDWTAGSGGKGKRAAGAIAMETDKHSRYHGNESGGSDRPRSDPHVRLYPYSPYGCAGHSAPLSLKGCTKEQISSSKYYL